MIRTTDDDDGVVVVRLLLQAAWRTLADTLPTSAV